jgi:hypothetical protein
MGHLCMGMAPEARPGLLSANPPKFPFGRWTSCIRKPFHTMCNFEQSGFCPSGRPCLSSRTIHRPGMDRVLTALAQTHGRGAWPRLASLAAGDEKPLSPPKHGRKYGQDRPCRYFSNDIKLAWRMTSPPRAIP